VCRKKGAPNSFIVIVILSHIIHSPANSHVAYHARCKGMDVLRWGSPAGAEAMAAMRGVERGKPSLIYMICMFFMRDTRRRACGDTNNKAKRGENKFISGLHLA